MVLWAKALRLGRHSYNLIDGFLARATSEDYKRDATLRLSQGAVDTIISYSPDKILREAVC